MEKVNKLSEREKSILRDYSKKRFDELMKFLKLHENNFSTKEISHLELAYHEPSNEIIMLCFYIANQTSLIYFNDDEILYDCPFEIILNKMSICFFMTCEMKENNNPDVFENYSFIPHFNSWDKAIENLKLAELNFTDDVKRVSQKVIDLVKKDQEINEVS